MSVRLLKAVYDQVNKLDAHFPTNQKKGMTYIRVKNFQLSSQFIETGDGFLSQLLKQKRKKM